MGGVAGLHKDGGKGWWPLLETFMMSPSMSNQTASPVASPLCDVMV